MNMLSETEDLENFLKKVDEISGVLNALNSSDTAGQEKAMAKADHLICTWEGGNVCKSQQDRTLINTGPASSHSVFAGTSFMENSQNNSDFSSEGFMKALEEDAEKTSKRRTEKEQMAKEYLGCVQQQEKVDQQEEQAQVEMGKETERATGVRELLNKLDTPNEDILYYCGGVKLLTDAVTDGTGQTLFRLNNGFSVINSHSTVRSCLSQDSVEPFAEELSLSVLRLWRRVSRDNEENQWLLMQHNSGDIVSLLVSASTALRAECLHLLCPYAYTQHGRSLLCDHLSLHKLVENLWECLSCQTDTELIVLNILEQLAGEDRFKIEMRGRFGQLFVSPFIHHLGNIGICSHKWTAQFVSVIGSMTTDNYICKEAACSQQCWDAFLIVMERCLICECKDSLCALLALMVQLSACPSPVLQEYAVPITHRCLHLLNAPHGGIITRSVALLSLLLPQSCTATQHATHAGVVKIMLKILKAQNVGQISTRSSIKVLVVCTRASQQARTELLNQDRRLRVVRRLLSSPDEVVAGNAALCLGHCVEETGGAAALLGTDVVPLLLRLAGGDAGAAGVQQNSAIALGKLCTAEPRHVVELRKRQGLEILHSCMKLVT